MERIDSMAKPDYQFISSAYALGETLYSLVRQHTIVAFWRQPKIMLAPRALCLEWWRDCFITWIGKQEIDFLTSNARRTW